MSKYIIDLRPDCKIVQQICVSDDNVGVGARSVELFDALTDEYVKENFKDLLEGEYQRGLEDGKAVNDKGCEGCMYNDGTKEHSPCDICCNAYLNRWTAKPQEDDDIKVGDEVIYSEHKFIVFATETEENYASLFDVNGRHASVSQRECKKTGRHFDISKILEEMKA